MTPVIKDILIDNKVNIKMSLTQTFVRIPFLDTVFNSTHSLIFKIEFIPMLTFIKLLSSFNSVCSFKGFQYIEFIEMVGDS